MKRVALLLSFVLLLSSLIDTAYAAQKPADNNFVSILKNYDSACIETSLDNDGFYEISISNTSMLFNNGNEQYYESENLKIVSLTSEQAKQVTKAINTTKASGTLEDDSWFLGYSCYIYIYTVYSIKTVSSFNYYRINSVKVSYQTNSGTILSSKELHMGCIGTTEANTSFMNGPSGVTVNVPSNPYTSYQMSYYPYIREGSPVLGASFSVTAVRPSGSSSTNTVSTVILNN